MRDLIDIGVEFLRSVLKVLLIGEDDRQTNNNADQKPSE